jgi:hypothetical protein
MKIKQAQMNTYSYSSYLTKLPIEDRSSTCISSKKCAPNYPAETVRLQTSCPCLPRTESMLTDIRTMEDGWLFLSRRTEYFHYCVVSMSLIWFVGGWLAYRGCG